MARYIQSHYAALVLLAGFSFLNPNLAVAQSNAERAARDLVERQGKTVLLFMHPTATFNGINLEQTQVFDSGNFRQTYRVHHTGWLGDKHWSEIHMNFRTDGSIDYVRGGNRSGIVAQFFASGTLVNQVKRSLINEPDIRNNETLLRTIERMTAEDLLVWVLSNSR